MPGVVYSVAAPRMYLRDPFCTSCERIRTWIACRDDWDLAVNYAMDWSGIVTVWHDPLKVLMARDMGVVVRVLNVGPSLSVDPELVDMVADPRNAWSVRALT